MKKRSHCWKMPTAWPRMKKLRMKESEPCYQLDIKITHQAYNELGERVMKNDSEEL